MQRENEAVLKKNTLVLILGLAGFISAADNWFVSPVLPAIAKGFNTVVTQAGNILTAYMIPYGIMQPFYGFVSDRWGKAKVLKWIVFGLALGTVGCAFAGSLRMLCLWRAITGFFAAGIIAVSLALIGDNVLPQERQVYVGKFMGILFFGQGLSVGLGGVLAKYFSWRIAFGFFAVMAACVLLFLQRVPNYSPFRLRVKFLSEVKRVVLTQKGRIIFPLAMVTGFLLLGLYSYLGAYLHEVTGLDYLQVGIVVMFYGFSCMLAGSQVGKLEQKLGRKKIVIIGGCFALSAALLLIVFSGWQTGWVATISLGFGYIFIQSTLATIAFDVATESKGLPSALVGLGLFGGGGLGSAFSSWLLHQGGYSILWLTFSIGMMIFIMIAAKLRFD